MRRSSTLCIALVSLCLAACSATPSADFYLLSANADPGSSTGAPSLGIASVAVAEYLRRPQIVTLVGANELRLHDYQRWAEPLDDGVRRTLLLNLSALLGSDSVRSMPWPREWQPEWLLRCEVERLDVGGSEVELVVSWSLGIAGGGQATVQRLSRLRRARTDSSVASVAGDVSELLLELSEEIAAALTGDAAQQTQ